MAVFRGEVRKNGKPLANARVAIHAPGLILGGSLGETHTAHDGRFGYELDPKHTRVVVYVDGQTKGEYRVADFASLVA